MRARGFHTAIVGALALVLAATNSFAQDASTSDASDPDMPVLACPGGSLGCAHAAIAYSRQVGLPLEFDIDTGWWPSGSPVQVRFRSALTGHTRVDAAGELHAAWPMPMTLRALPTAGTGLLESDYGIVLDARVRLHLEVSGTTYNWEGSVPYVPHIDFRAMASTAFDPWAWDPINVRGSTMRQHLADVPLTDSFIPIPGVSGGLSFDAQADLATSYRSTQITFGGDADPLTQSTDHVLALFTAGPSVDYFPQLEGQVDQTITMRIYPSIYVELLGRRWMVDLFELPVDIGPIAQPWVFDPSQAHLLLPDVQRRSNVVIDFGDVPVGSRASDGVPFDSLGDVDLYVRAPNAAGGFFYPRSTSTAPPHSTITMPVEFAPAVEGPAEVRVPFVTSDPDTPAVYVTLRGNGIAGPSDASVVTDASSDVANDVDRGDASDADGGDGGLGGAMRGGCGCAVPGRHGDSRALGGSVLVMMALASGWSRRRRVRT